MTKGVPVNDKERIARAVIESEYGPGTWDDAIRWGHDDIVRKGHREADAVLAALDGRLLPELPEWIEHVEISIGSHYHEWQEGGKKHWHWRRSCWGEGSTLANAIDNMMSKSCVTQASWDSRVRMNPHLAIQDAVAEAEGDDAD